MKLVIAFVALLAACGDDDDRPDFTITGPYSGFDLYGVPDCPAGATEAHVAKCDPKTDTICWPSNSNGQQLIARCLCNGYWETDQVLPFCDGGS